MCFSELILTRCASIALAKRYGQMAIVYVESGEVAELVITKKY